MNKEYLQNYEEREFEEYAAYEKQFLSSDTLLQYPSKTRFNKIQDPITIYDFTSHTFYGEKLWSQIPFAGTLIISLRDISEKQCIQQGFEVSDIPKLIELAKDQGKIQFALNSKATFYEGLDYLDPIFQELEPPMLRSIPAWNLADDNDIKKWRIEFETLGQINYFEHHRNKINAMGEGPNFFLGAMDKRGGAWEKLHILKRQDDIKQISSAMVDDPDFADVLFNRFLLSEDQIFDPFTPNCNVSLKYLEHFGLKSFNVSKNLYINDIGKFILQKILLHPTSYNSCMEVITHYQQNELYNVMDSLHQSIKNQRTDETLSKINNLNEIMENAWQDGSKLKGRKEILDTGLLVTLGLCGGMVTNQIAAVGMVGILAKLGFKVAEHRLSFLKLGEKIIKKINPDYLVNIYDFQKKIPLKK